jgi:proline iminopeptidase
MALREFYPVVEPHSSGHLEVSGGHRVYWEECGNPEGRPVIFVHGGPGGGIHPDYRRFFDPTRYRIVLFDQRGCGQSTPHAGLENNTTWDLVADMEAIREDRGVDKWQVFGGSWGSTLALVYAQKHPDRCLELVLRGIFMMQPQELHWFYQEGSSAIYPDAWQPYLDHIPVEEQHDLMGAYHKRLTSDDEETRLTAAKIWSTWEASTSHLYADPSQIDDASDPHFALAFARIECHYFMNGGFLEQPDQILRDVPRIAHIPCVIVQGRYDVICPVRTAWSLKRAWPDAELRIIADAGHSAFEPGIRSALLEATDAFAS